MNETSRVFGTAAVEQADSCRDRRWIPWGYDGTRRALVLTTASYDESTLDYLICWQPSYVRLRFGRFASEAEFTTGTEAVERMSDSPPASFLPPGARLLVIRADAQEYCIVCSEAEFRSFAAQQGG